MPSSPARQEEQARRDLYGLPDPWASSRLGLAADVLRHGRAGRIIWESRRIQGWIRGKEALSLFEASRGLRGDPVVVEIGAFLGCSTVLLAGSRRLQGSGIVHTIDPFAATGDTFSVPIYEEIAGGSSLSLRERFDANLRRAGLSRWVNVHQTTALDAAAAWDVPIDLLYLDGDQSPRASRDAFLAWSKFLKRGGVLALNNSADGPHPPDHDGSLRVVKEFLRWPAYDHVHTIEALTFAVRNVD